MRQNNHDKTETESSPSTFPDWAILQTPPDKPRARRFQQDGKDHARREFSNSIACARALDREADAALFYGRATMAERLSHRAAELREAAR